MNNCKGVQNSFSEPKFSLKGDPDFNEGEAWELRSKSYQKDFMTEMPLFQFVFSDWISREGQGTVCWIEIYLVVTAKSNQEGTKSNWFTQKKMS